MQYLQNLWQITARFVPASAAVDLFALFRETDARLVAEVEVARLVPLASALERQPVKQP